MPALQLGDGELLTEGPAILQYIADRRPHDNLAFAYGSRERYQLQAVPNFIASEVHKAFASLFKAEISADRRLEVRELLRLRFQYLSDQIGARAFLIGDRFTVADAYLFTVLNWTGFVGIELSAWPILDSYCRRIGGRPKVQEALQAEGLVQQSIAKQAH